MLCGLLKLSHPAAPAPRVAIGGLRERIKRLARRMLRIFAPLLFFLPIARYPSSWSVVSKRMLPESWPPKPGPRSYYR
jgi:hypothetical protein